jgi:hypothetical protein
MVFLTMIKTKRLAKAIPEESKDTTQNSLLLDSYII